MKEQGEGEKPDTPQKEGLWGQKVRDEDAKIDDERQRNLGPETWDTTGRGVLQGGDLLKQVSVCPPVW